MRAAILVALALSALSARCSGAAVTGSGVDASARAAPVGSSASRPRETLARVTVSAGHTARNHSIVWFDYDEGAGRSLVLVDAAGAEHPVQIDDQGRAVFVLQALAAGEQAVFSLMTSARDVAATATANAVDGVIRLGVATHTVTDFQLRSTPPQGVDELYARGGYLHPFHTPAGVMVTDDYPEDHRHHHGIWSAWTRATFKGHQVDFWNVQSKQGRVDLDKVNMMWQGPVHAGFDASLTHVDLVAGMTALNERWLVRVYATHATAAPYFVFDLESTQAAATTEPVELLQYNYGGFAIRGHSAWTAGKARFVTSEGHDAVMGDNQSARWCFIGGDVDGRAVGYAALGHPSNFRAPQKLRIHPTDPYLAFAPVRDGAFSIQPGEPYVTRFRFVSVDGAPDPTLFDRLWHDYAVPASVTISAP